MYALHACNVAYKAKFPYVMFNINECNVRNFFLSFFKYREVSFCNLNALHCLHKYFEI